ncbi:membrane protein [Noviherbaspirillum humi]|uniref:Membrane protein n=1 Tax=Noviherbaspirillum humi TaxID=1688639 RepID=A0A239IXF2_9BURK|nr:YihY/virulence factor BrkB family protein [Noviherbaspirillum humi]SNS98195.1 membrane protein [Noviherbaspirillum humi]
MTFPCLYGLSLFALIRESFSDFMEDDMTTYASALAYQVLFSIFPFIIFLIALLGFLHMPGFFDWLRQQVQMLLPGQALPLVNKVIGELQKEQSGLLSVGVLLALWSASAGVRATINALNVAYDVRERRPAWKLYPLSIFYTVGIAAMLAAAAALMVVGPQAMEWLAGWIGLKEEVVIVWAVLRWPAAMLLLMMVVALVYYLGPNLKQRFRLLSPGAVLSVLVWIAASLGFDYYVRSFADYSVMYGSIGTIIILLLYFFVSAAVLLFGAEVNHVIDRHQREMQQDAGRAATHPAGSASRPGDTLGHPAR